MSLKGRRCIISRHAKWLPVTLTETFWKRFSKLNHRDRKKINKKRKNGNNRENDCRRQQSRAAHCVVGRHVAAGRSKKNDGEKDFAALLPLRRDLWGVAVTQPAFRVEGAEKLLATVMWVTMSVCHSSPGEWAGPLGWKVAGLIPDCRLSAWISVVTMT